MFYLINNHFDFIKNKYTLKFKREYNKIQQIKKLFPTKWIHIFMYICKYK